MSWRPRTIRSRLALGYALAVAVTVMIYGGVVYAFTQASLIEQLDARLHDDFERAEDAFEIAADGSLSWKEVERPGHGDAAAEAPWKEVLHPTGGASIRWPAKEDPEAGPFRIYEQDYVIAGDTYRIRLGRSMAPMRAQLRSLLALLALCLVPVVGLAWLVGHVLARRALRPVGVMTERAHAIGRGQLSERLPVGPANDELDRLAVVFNEAFSRLERSFERLRRFTSDAAHELRTPLAALRSVGEVGLGRSEDVEADREVIASMLEESGRLTRLVEELLELSRGDAARSPLETAPVELVELARSVCDQLEVLASERGQAITIEGGASAVVPGDPASLRRAVTNLVDNAIRHGPASSSIRVCVQARGAEVILSVGNEGEGIAPEHRERLFDRFYRVDPSRAGTGTGLGLALAAQAVAAHGGRIELDSPPEGGVTFRIVLTTGSS